MKKWLMVLILTLTFTLAACDGEQSENGDITVYSSLFPQYDIVRALAGDYVNNAFMLNPGVDAHTYEPSPRMVADVLSSDALIYTNGFMEPWITTFVEEQENYKYRLLNLSDNIDTISYDDTHHDNHSHDHGAESEIHTFKRLDRGEDESVLAYIHGNYGYMEGLQDGSTQVVFELLHGVEPYYETPPINVSVQDDVKDIEQAAFDPHIWTTPRNMIQMAYDIEALLIDLVPAHETSIAQNADAYRSELESLHQSFEHITSHAEIKTFMLGGHNAMGYFTHEYGLEMINPYRGFSTDSAPTSQAIAEMIDRMNDNDIAHLFSEHIVYPMVADTISEETGADILYLHNGANLGADDFDYGMTMLDIFEHNLKQMKIGLRYEEE